MAIPILVAQSGGSTYRNSRALTRQSRSVRTTSRGFQTNPCTLAFIRLQDIGQIIKKKGISDEASEVVCNRWALATQRNYEYIWRRWKAFCSDGGRDPIYPQEADVVNFLHNEWKKYNTASAVNHAISSLTSVLEFSMGYPLMSMPLVAAFRKSVNIMRPTGPASVSTWDVVIIFKFIRSMGDNNRLPLSQLQLKVILLLRLDLLSRSSDLVKLYRSEVQWSENYFRVRFLRPKEWRPEGKNAIREWSTWISVYRVQDETWCLYRALKSWMERTADKVLWTLVGETLRQPVVCNTSGKGFRALSVREISFIAACGMSAAGVPGFFKPQSIRGAVASALLDYGVPVAQVLAQGRWADKAMVMKYYYRQITRKKGKVKGNLQETLRSAV